MKIKIAEMYGYSASISDRSTRLCSIQIVRHNEGNNQISSVLTGNEKTIAGLEEALMESQKFRNILVTFTSLQQCFDTMLDAPSTATKLFQILSISL